MLILHHRQLKDDNNKLKVMVFMVLLYNVTVQRVEKGHLKSYNPSRRAEQKDNRKTRQKTSMWRGHSLINQKAK